MLELKTLEKVRGVRASRALESARELGFERRATVSTLYSFINARYQRDERQNQKCGTHSLYSAASSRGSHHVLSASAAANAASHSVRG